MNYSSTIWVTSEGLTEHGELGERELEIPSVAEIHNSRHGRKVGSPPCTLHDARCLNESRPRATTSDVSGLSVYGPASLLEPRRTFLSELSSSVPESAPEISTLPAQLAFFYSYLTHPLRGPLTAGKIQLPTMCSPTGKRA